MWSNMRQVSFNKIEGKTIKEARLCNEDAYIVFTDGTFACITGDGAFKLEDMDPRCGFHGTLKDMGILDTIPQFTGLYDYDGYPILEGDKVRKGNVEAIVGRDQGRFVARQVTRERFCIDHELDGDWVVVR